MNKTGEYIKCPICSTDFWVKKSHLKFRKCCSIKCDGISRSRKPAWNKGTKGIIKPNKGSFQKGHPKPKNAYKFLKGKNSICWKGGRNKHTAGYILIYSPNHPYAINGNYVFEHRLIIEKHLGRYLLPKEVGHHLGKKTDNRPHMLMAFINLSAHTRFHYNPNNVKPSEIIFDGRKL